MQIQNEASFDLHNTTGISQLGNPYYSQIKPGTGNVALKSECKILPACKTSVTGFADKNLPSNNVTSYEKLGLINHSPYVGLGPINSPNQILSQESNIQNFTAYTEINEAVGKEGLQVESSIKVKDHSEKRTSVSHSDSSYTKMASFTQSQKLKPDVAYQYDSLHFHAVGDILRYY